MEQRLAQARQLLEDPGSGLSGSWELAAFVQSQEASLRLRELLLDEQGQQRQGLSALDQKKVWRGAAAPNGLPSADAMRARRRRHLRRCRRPAARQQSHLLHSWWRRRRRCPF